MILGSYEKTRRKLVIQENMIQENIHIQLLAFKSIFYVIIKFLCRLEPFWQLNVNTVCF